MFSIPRRLLFGDQSKLDFKLDAVNGFARLYSERHIPYHDSRYWSGFLQFDSPSDIFSLLSLADLRKARQHAPENIVTLVRVLVAHLESLIVDPSFSPPPASMAAQASAASYLGSLSSWRIPGTGADSQQGQQDQRDRAREALNVSAEARPAQGATSTPVKQAAAGADAATESQFVIDDDDDEDDDDEAEGGAKRRKSANGAKGPTSTDEDPLQAPTTPSVQGAREDEDGVPPVALGERLIRLTIDLLFCSGFTIPWTEEQLTDLAPGRSPNKIHYAIWEAGVGSSVDLPGTTRQHTANRNEVLRLLLVLLSKSIYVPAEKQSSFVDPALRFTVQELERGVLLPLMCSLLNTSLANPRSSVSAWLGLPSVVGGGVGSGGSGGGGGGGLGSLGLGGSSGEEVQTSLVSQSLQVLDVLLSYEPPQPSETDTASLSTLGPPQPGPGGKNIFRFYLSKLHREADFDFIWTGMARSLGEHVASPIQILAIQIPTTGGSSRRNAGANWHLNQVAERLMLLWRLLELNAKFRHYLLDHPQRAPALVSFLLYFALTYKDNLALQGLVRLCAFMLQDVSSHRDLGVQLAKPGSASRVQLPMSRLGLVPGATAIDALVQAVYSLIATTKGQLSSLYPPLLITLTNTAPSWRSLSITSSTRLIHLLRSFSQPAFLLSDENNPRLLFYVLETINSVFAVQYAANPNLVYAFVLAHKLLPPLEHFSLRRGVEEVWKKRRALGTDTRDWFEGAPRLEKVPLPPPTSSSSPSSSSVPVPDETASGTTPTADGEKADDDERGDRPATALEKGKMRRISTSSSSTAAAATAAAAAAAGGEWQSELSKYSDETVEAAARKYIGKNGFRPTQAWVESWQSGLPLHPLRLVIDRLLPEVERIASGADGSSSQSNPAGGGGNVDEKVLAFIREQDMTGFLPPPPNGIHPRPWQWTLHASIWLKSYLWGTIYVSSLLPYGVWADTQIALFRIHERPDPSAAAHRAPPASGSSTPSSTPASNPIASTTGGGGLSDATRQDLGLATPSSAKNENAAASKDDETKAEEVEMK
ncbi:uncharacterized protein PSFLO_05131 [Pseudozyma flocculosa]|uniref:Uncharacterized protein n=1 Tax=Pseudozyma flocculosa TaxID=84751 RepID=A0A5C3F684_9BASI|nr:uncharacterized protein PSFLO_05131 [Pseudozyma flocculosa]